MYFFGLIILSIAVGHRFDTVDGFLALGAGLILFPVLKAIIIRIPVRNTIRKE